MVAVEEIGDTTMPSPSQERLWDAEDIEALISMLKRPTARMQVESLVKKVRKEAQALKAIESSSTATPPSVATITESKESSPPKPAIAPTPRQPISLDPIATTNSPSITYTTIDRFAFDPGSSSDKFVTLYVPIPGVGSIEKKNIQCDFGKDSFDVTVANLNGKNYRLKRDNLEHDIEPGKSKFIVKTDKIVVKLHKVKEEYGFFGHWNKLTDPGKKDKNKKKSSEPKDSLMDMMKDLYDKGDDKMKKMIGETMLKQRNGELSGKDF